MDILVGAVFLAALAGGSLCGACVIVVAPEVTRTDDIVSRLRSLRDEIAAVRAQVADIETEYVSSGSVTSGERAVDDLVDSVHAEVAGDLAQITRQTWPSAMQAVYDTLAYSSQLLQVKRKKYRKLFKRNRPSKYFRDKFQNFVSMLDTLQDNIKRHEIAIFGDLEETYGRRINMRIKLGSTFDRTHLHLHNLLYWKITLEYLEDKYSFLERMLVKAKPDA